MPNVLLSPVGTSLLTNQRPDQATRDALNDWANAPSRESVPAEARSALDAVVAQAAQAATGAPLARAAELSAELNGIISFYGGQPPSPRDHHILLCTDTWLGQATGSLVAGWLREQGCTEVFVPAQRDLRTADVEAFQAALSDVVNYAEDTLPGYSRQGYRVVFNLTGGFKGVQGFLQTLAQFYADETIYVFQGSSLLRIPRLPVRMDTEGVVLENLRALRRLALDRPVATDELARVPETLTLRSGDGVCLSTWGDLVWVRGRSTLYPRVVYPPPSDLIRLGPKFEASVRGISADERATVNERLDDLTRYLESGRQLTIRRLDYKRLKGNPKPPSTHEFDAWADKSAWRVYCHEEGSVCVLDELGPKLANS